MDNFNVSFVDYSYTYSVKGFDPARAVNHISIEDVTEGDIICIIGPNGSGKTTLLDAIVGKLKTRNGEGEINITLFNGCLDANRKELKILYIPQKPSLGFVSDLSIIENLALKKIAMGTINFRKAISKTDRIEIAAYVKRHGFGFLIEKFDMPPDALSGGEQQILNLLSTIYADPHIIVMDEPTSKIDEINKIGLWNLIVKATKEKGIAILCATHEHDMVEKVADRVISLRNGSVEYEQQLRRKLTERFIGEIRYVKQVSELPVALSNVKDDWWKPGENMLFDQDYFVGDNSTQGYLAHKTLTRGERTKREVDGIMRITEIKKGDHLLDIPCGWGRHSMEFGKKGVNVIGIDMSENYINMAKEDAKNKKIENVEFRVGDMRNVPKEENSFDVIINMWTSFGFFNDIDNEKVLMEFNRVLKPEGMLLIHCDLNPERVKMGIFVEPWERDLYGGGKLEVKEYYCAGDRKIYGTWSVSSTKNIHTYKISIYTQREWKMLGKKFGYSSVKFFGGFEKNDELLTVKSQEFIILLKK